MAGLSGQENMDEVRADITKPKDVHRVVKSFFKKVRKDDLLASYFKDKNKAEWEAFLAVMNSFWENALFYTGGYFGNPMQKHSDLNRNMHLQPDHYARWMQLFEASIDERFAGENAERMKERARNIASIMQVKIT